MAMTEIEAREKAEILSRQMKTAFVGAGILGGKLDIGACWYSVGTWAEPDIWVAKGLVGWKARREGKEYGCEVQVDPQEAAPNPKSRAAFLKILKIQMDRYLAKMVG